MTDFLFRRFGKLTAKINEIEIPIRAVGSILSRHVVNIIVDTTDNTYPISLMGSGTALRFQNHHILICTQHQIKNIDHNNIMMLVENGQKMTSSTAAYYFPVKEETDGFDIVVFNFDSSAEIYPEIRSKFFNVNGKIALNNEVIGVLIIGCPTKEQLYDVYDKNRIEFTKRVVVCDQDHNLPNDQATMSIIPREPLLVDPDGMSGGAAFLITNGDSGLEVFFGGIVIQGGKNRFTVIKAGIIIDILTKVSKIDQR